MCAVCVKYNLLFSVNHARIIVFALTLLSFLQGRKKKWYAGLTEVAHKLKVLTQNEYAVRANSVRHCSRWECILSKAISA